MCILITKIINNADVIVLMTKHKDYFNLDFTKLKNKMKTPIIIDGRNVCKKKDCETPGFIYKGISKPR